MRTLVYIFIFLISFASVHSVFAAAPTRSLGFQGQLFDGGLPLTASVNATFTFYDAASGGSVSGSTISKTVTVNKGYFGTQFSEADLSGVDFNQALYIEVNVNGTTLSPRTALNSTPSSLKAFGAFSYSSAPAVGPAGSLYFNLTSNTLFVSNGTSWTSAASQWGTNGSTISYTSGNVGIGTTTPSARLDVWGNLQVGTSSTPTLFVDTSASGSGRVGIGTSTPGRNLTIAGSMSIVRSGSPHIELIQTGAGTDLRNWRLAGEADGSFTIYPMTDANSNLRPLRYTHDGRLVVTSSAGTNIDSRLFIDSGSTASTSAVFLGGNVGVGTSSPASAVDVWGNLRVGTSSTPLILTDVANDQVLVGTTTPRDTRSKFYIEATPSGTARPFWVWGNGFRAARFTTTGVNSLPLEIDVQQGATGTPIMIEFVGLNAASSTAGYGRFGFEIADNTPSAQSGDFVITSRNKNIMGNIFRITSSGSVGIGSTTPTATLHASGTIRFSSLGAGTLTTDASGNVTVSSDERLKDIKSTFMLGLDAIKGISPITYAWKSDTGYDTVSTYAGFSAQNVQQSIPEAVGTDSRGFLTLNDRPILAALVNAVKELASKFEGFAKKVETDELCIKKPDGLNKVCLTANQLEQMLAAQGTINTVSIEPQTPAVPTEVATSTEPAPVSTLTPTTEELAPQAPVEPSETPIQNP